MPAQNPAAADRTSPASTLAQQPQRIQDRLPSRATAAPDSPITKAPLRDVDFPRDALVGGIARGDDAFIAVGDTQVLAGDRVVIFTSPQSARKVERIFN